VDDYRAYRQLNRMGVLSFRSWVRSVLHRQTFPFFRWYDPLPAIVKGARFFAEYLGRHLGSKKLLPPAGTVGAARGVSAGARPAGQASIPQDVSNCCAGPSHHD
jgi:hypothetical protein